MSYHALRGRIVMGSRRTHLFGMIFSILLSSCLAPERSPDVALQVAKIEVLSGRDTLAYIGQRIHLYAVAVDDSGAQIEAVPFSRFDCRSDLQTLTSRIVRANAEFR